MQNYRPASRFCQGVQGHTSYCQCRWLTWVIHHADYSKLSPSMTYEVVSPFFGSMMEECQHRQISDKAFEQKSREAMVHYLHNHKLPFHELDRVIEVAGEIVAEWEGVFELEDGQVWFLE